MKNLYQMIKQAVTSLLVNHSGPYPRGQANYNGKTTEFTFLIPYGLISNPPVGSHVLLFSSQGQESVKLGFVSDFDNKSGINDEVLAGLRNGFSETEILLRENGDLEIDAKNDLTITIAADANLTIIGDVNMTVTGDINLTATGTVNLGGAGGAGVARIGDSVAGGVITGGSAKVKAVS